MYSTPPPSGRSTVGKPQLISPITPMTKRKLSIAFAEKDAPLPLAKMPRKTAPVRCQHQLQHPAIFRFPEQQIGCRWRQQTGQDYYCCELEIANDEDLQFLELVWLLRVNQNHDDYMDNGTPHVKQYINSINTFMQQIKPDESPPDLLVTADYCDYAVDHAAAVAFLMQFNIVVKMANTDTSQQLL
jgi:hypothetical protein